MSQLSLNSKSLCPRVSIVTVTLNDKIGLALTIKSVLEQDYENKQFIVIDGLSSDGSVELLQQFQYKINQLRIEKDAGVYHAMNKAIALADGEWLIFMNAGDTFSAPNVLLKAISETDDDVDVVYSDWIYSESGQLVKANLKKLNVRHQSVMYKKSLHDIYGDYVVGKKVSISDYIFFLSIAQKRWKYCSTPISLCKKNGISANPAHFYQRIAAELMFSRRGRLGAAFILVVHPAYRFLKHKVLRLS